MLLHKRGVGRERDKRQYWPFLRQCREVSIPLCNCRQFLDTNLVRIAPSGALRNCFNLRYFTQEERGIGYSFQLAITAPLYSITGYCIATAQSCLSYGTISGRTDDKRNNALRGWCPGLPWSTWLKLERIRHRTGTREIIRLFRVNVISQSEAGFSNSTNP